MKKYYNIFLITLTAFLFGTCSNNDEPIIEQDDGMIEISYAQSKFDVSVWNGTRSAEFRAETQVGTDSENAVDNLYILMFKTDGTDPIKYFVDNAFPATSGEWDKVNEIVKLKVTQAEAGTRDVYVIANVGGLKGALDGVTNETGLDALLNSSDTPWSASLGSPADTGTRILMSGSKLSHNFQTTRKLESVELIRALAKVELNITLGTKHQDADESLYQYNFVDFDKNTFVLENTTKTASKATFNWQGWQETGNVSTYKKTGDKVTSLTLVTYINETTNAGSLIDIKLPYNDGGLLPPPEFGPETFQLPLPDKIVRNTWYKYDIEI